MGDGTETRSGAPMWVVVLLAVVASAGLATAITLVATRPSAEVNEATAPNSTAVEETSTSPPSAPVVEAPTTTTTTVFVATGPPPEGGLIFGKWYLKIPGDDQVYGSEYCEECHQVSLGSCGLWTVRITNDSNVAVTSFTFPADRGTWSHSTDFSRPDVSAEALPRTIEVRIEPYETRFVEFQICSSTPPPGSGYEFMSYAPGSITFTWETGHVGTAPFR